MHRVIRKSEVQEFIFCGPFTQKTQSRRPAANPFIAYVLYLSGARGGCMPPLRAALI